MTRYVVDKNRDFAQVLEEVDGLGALVVRYVHGDDLISQSRAGTTSYYHYDGLGSTRALSNDTGGTTYTYTYDAFGNLIVSVGTTRNDYLFTGEQLDPNIGFYYLRARYYDPALGRFLTMDAFPGTMFDPITLHKYLYANVNPINVIDPSGRFGLASVGVSLSVRSILVSIAFSVPFRAIEAALAVAGVITESGV